MLAQSADEAAVRALVVRYFATYPTEDLEAAIRLTGEQSSERAAAKKRLESFFAANDRIEVTVLQIRQLVIEGERARASATIQVSAVS